MKIVTDSGADLSFPKEILESLDIETVPLKVSLDNKTYREDIDIHTGDFYHLLKNTKSLPTTTPPSVGDFAEIYQKISATDPDILSIHISSTLSETFSTAVQAAKLVPRANIMHFDSHTLSAVVGWMVEAASRAIRAGWSKKQILALLRVIGERSSTIYTVEDLKYLINGGRISHIKGLTANLFNIKPIITIDTKNGIFKQLGQERSFKGALKGIIKQMNEQHEFGTRLRAQVLHSYSHENAAAFKYQLDQLYDIEWLPIGEMSLVLGAHTGPSMVGVAYSEQSLFDHIERI
jgi:DegV family protein with EDD domain